MIGQNRPRNNLYSTPYRKELRVVGVKESFPGLIAMENDGSQNFIPFPAVFHGRNAAFFAQTRGPSRPDMNPAWDENFAFKNGVGKKQFSGFGLENVFIKELPEVVDKDKRSRDRHCVIKIT